MNRYRAWMLALLLACTPANAEMAPPSKADVRVTAIGDTARLAVSWPAARGATGYQLTVTVTASNGTWSGLTPQATTALGATVNAISTTADSASFTACVRSTRGTETSAAQRCSSPKTWKRALLPPDSVRIDTIAVLHQLELYPQTATVMVGSQVQVCAYYRFTTGRVALRPVDVYCTVDYNTRFSAAERSLTQEEQDWISCAGRYVFDPGCQAGQGSRFLQLERRAE